MSTRKRTRPKKPTLAELDASSGRPSKLIDNAPTSYEAYCAQCDQPLLPRGRPPIDNPRNHVLQVRVTEDEYNAVVKRAHKRTLSDVVRELIRRGLKG